MEPSKKRLNVSGLTQDSKHTGIDARDVHFASVRSNQSGPGAFRESQLGSKTYPGFPGAVLSADPKAPRTDLKQFWLSFGALESWKY